MTHDHKTANDNAYHAAQNAIAKLNRAAFLERLRGDHLASVLQRIVDIQFEWTSPNALEVAQQLATDALEEDANRDQPGFLTGAR